MPHRVVCSSVGEVGIRDVREVLDIVLDELDVVRVSAIFSSYISMAGPGDHPFVNNCGTSTSEYHDILLIDKSPCGFARLNGV